MTVVVLQGPSGPSGAVGPSGGPTGATGATGPIGTTVSVNTRTSSYTLALSDAQYVVEMNSASANLLTVPANVVVAFPIGTVVEVCQLGVGQTTIVPDGIIIRTPSSLILRTQYSSAVLRKRATDEWVIGGDLV